MRYLTVILLGAVCSLALSATDCPARVWYVPDEVPTIQAGLDSAVAGDIVEVTCGTYFEHDLQMKSGVFLRGAGNDPGCVTIDAQGLARVLTCEDSGPGTAFQGITFKSGWSLYIGGGVLVNGGQATFTACRFTSCSSANGSGLAVMVFATVVLEGCLFDGNSAINDGGGLYHENSAGEINYCVFRNNEAGAGGGLSVWYPISPVTITSCTIAGNTADFGAGAGLNSDLVSFDRCLIAMNVGPAVFAIGSTPPITCTDIFGNTGGDWTDNIAGLVAINGNFSANPCFCDLEGGDLRLCADSWCLPGNHPWGCDELVGALGVGCSACDCPSQGPVSNELTTWGSMKALYR